MALCNTHDRYGSIAKLFHWLIAILIIGMLVMGTSFGFIDQNKALMSILIPIHKSTGLTILLLMALRFLWRLINPSPQLPETTPTWQKRLAHLSHQLLYLTAFLMPLSGWLMSTAAGYTPVFWYLFKVPMPFIEKSKAVSSIASDAHTALAWILFSLIAIHIAGALKHHIVDKDNVLRRMMPGYR